MKAKLNRLPWLNSGIPRKIASSIRIATTYIRIPAAGDSCAATAVLPGQIPTIYYAVAIIGNAYRPRETTVP